MKNEHPPFLRSKIFFILCYTLLIVVISFVGYLEYQWYTQSNELPELVLNLDMLSQSY